MDTQQKDGQPTDQQLPLNPLRRVFVPIEKRNVHGVWQFKTADGDKYTRDPKTGVIRRVKPKVNGKEAKRLRKACR